MIQSKAVKIRGVSLKYDQRPVLVNVDIEIDSGSYCGIAGPNGSGKTTLAYLISKILKPDEGIIDTGEHRIGFIMTNPENQIVSLLVEEDIAFGPENLGLSSAEIQRKISGSLKTLCIENLRLSLTSTLSGGQLSRVAIAGQLAMDADIIIFDEGSIMLDQASRKNVLEVLNELNKSHGKTIVHITHRLDDLMNATKVVCLVNGQIKSVANDSYTLLSQESISGGIEPGAEIIFKAFLKNAGISTQCLPSAVNELRKTKE